MARREHNNYGSGVTLNPIKIEDAAALLSCYYFMIVALLLFYDCSIVIIYRGRIIVSHVFSIISLKGI